MTMTDREKSLVPIYDGRTSYYSPLDHISAHRIAALLGHRPAGPHLDIGCGNGRIGKELGSFAGGVIDGIDVSEKRLAIAKERGYRNLECRSAYDLPEGEWQTIWAIEVLEHLEKPLTVIQSALLRLLPDGVMIATVPIQLPADTHLDVYQSLHDASFRLSAHREAEFTVGKNRHAALLWNAPERTV